MMEFWDQAIQVLSAVETAPFLSPEYMAAANEAAALFIEASKDLATTDPERSDAAAGFAVDLLRFTSQPWPENPDDVVTDVSEDAPAAQTPAGPDVEGQAALNAALISAATTYASPAALAPRRTAPKTAPAAPASGGGGPLHAPTAWFSDPGLKGPTPITITPEGRVYGHIALWGTCHVGHSHNGRCITPPRSGNGYASFHLGAHRTAEGNEVSVGHLTMAAGHANDDPDKGPVSASYAISHYDNTATAVADVRAGEDKFGIWVAGTLTATATPAQVQRLRSSPISGDWRQVGTATELIAALCVNVPGFPVPRPSGLVAGGKLVVLTAAGMLAPRKVARPGTPGALSDEDYRYLKRLAQQAKASDVALVASAAKDAADAARARVARAKVAAFAAGRKDH